MIHRFALAVAVLVASSVAFCQAPPAKIAFTTKTKTVAPGAKLSGTIEVAFSPGFHAYANPPSKEYMIPLALSLDGKTGKLVQAKYSKGDLRPSGGYPEPIAVYEGTVKIPIVIEMPKAPGKYTFKIVASYQQCNEASCFAPEKSETQFVITVAKPKPRAPVRK